MIIYFVSTEGILENILLSQKANILYSYFYNPSIEALERCLNNGGKMFLDSGAFSAYTQNKSIDLKKYISFIKKTERFITSYASLDVLYSPEKTKKNYQKMKKASLNPIPVVHRGCDLEYIDYYLDNTDYFALGGLAAVGTSMVDNKIWLDKVWNYILKKSVKNVKVHGFGLTSDIYVKNYPWYSVDGSSWIWGSKFARVFTPFGTVYFGDNKDKKEYFYNLPNLFQKKIVQYAQSKGFTIENLFKDYKQRNGLNIQYYKDIADNSDSQKILEKFANSSAEQLFLF